MISQKMLKETVETVYEILTQVEENMKMFSGKTTDFRAEMPVTNKSQLDRLHIFISYFYKRTLVSLVYVNCTLKSQVLNVLMYISSLILFNGMERKFMLLICIKLSFVPFQ
jgi:hypothetical protein